MLTKWKSGQSSIAMKTPDASGNSEPRSAWRPVGSSFQTGLGTSLGSWPLGPAARAEASSAQGTGGPCQLPGPPSGPRWGEEGPRQRRGRSLRFHAQGVGVHGRGLTRAGPSARHSAEALQADDRRRRPARAGTEAHPTAGWCCHRAGAEAGEENTLWSLKTRDLTMKRSGRRGRRTGLGRGLGHTG